MQPTRRQRHLHQAEDDFPELLKLERIIQEGVPHLRIRNVCDVPVDGRRFPVYALCLGNVSREVPAVGFFAGIHGLERIGTQVLLSFLHSLLRRLRWDHLLQRQLASVCLVFMPLVNPGGMWRGTRSNPRGVDLMRNAPVESAQKVPFMYGGHRISARLPWYRGPAEAIMEIENRAVCSVVQEELFGREFSLALDCHSGFGLRDRIWFPYAYTAEPIRHLPEVDALYALFEQAYPHHNYLFEPQCRQYLAHGDLWDYLYLQAPQHEDRIFLPLTLEMGSWLWIKKSPRQLFSRLGIFNPLPVHRLQRVLRSHLLWMDFLVRAAGSYRRWLPARVERAPLANGPRPLVLSMAAWILMRGLMRESRHWGGFPAVLRAQFPGVQVLTLDLPGNGRLYRSSSPTRVEQMVECSRRELSARGITPPYHLLGLSMGAMVAVAWGALHPQELRGCVLINSSLGGFDPFYRRLRPRAYPALPILIGGDSIQQERAILRLTSCRGDAQPSILDAWVAYRRECPVSRRNALRQLIAAARFRAPACRPDVPVLVLASALDGLVDPSCSRNLASRWKTALAIHPRAGHDLPLDDAAWVARQVRDWLVTGPSIHVLEDPLPV